MFNLFFQTLWLCLRLIPTKQQPSPRAIYHSMLRQILLEIMLGSGDRVGYRTVMGISAR